MGNEVLGTHWQGHREARRGAPAPARTQMTPSQESDAKLPTYALFPNK